MAGKSGEFLARICRRWTRVFQEEVRGWTDSALRGALDPAKLMDLMRKMGVDFSRLPGLAGQQPLFDPYQILGLDKSASDDELKERYRELVNRLHPDKSGTPGTGFLLQIVLAAYEMIKRQRGLQ
jgi:hypothetical protein